MRRLGQGKENDLLTGYRTNVVVQAQHLDAGDLLDHHFQDRPGRFHQMRPYLFEQVPALLGGKCLDKLLLGRCQNPLEANHEEITEEEA